MLIRFYTIKKSMHLDGEIDRIFPKEFDVTSRIV